MRKLIGVGVEVSEWCPKFFAFQHIFDSFKPYLNKKYFLQKWLYIKFSQICIAFSCYYFLSVFINHQLWHTSLTVNRGNQHLKLFHLVASLTKLSFYICFVLFHRFVLLYIYVCEECTILFSFLCWMNSNFYYCLKEERFLVTYGPKIMLDRHFKRCLTHNDNRQNHITFSQEDFLLKGLKSFKRINFHI